MPSNKAAIRNMEHEALWFLSDMVTADIATKNLVRE